MAVEPVRVLVAFSGLPEAARRQASRGSLGQRLQVCDSAEATHLVVQPPVRRTLKLLHALSRGAWVVSPAWLADSSVAHRLLDPSPYELVADVPGCRIARLRAEHGRLGPLCGVHVSFSPSATTVPCAELKVLLAAAGATVALSRDGSPLCVWRKGGGSDQLLPLTESDLLDAVTGQQPPCIDPGGDAPCAAAGLEARPVGVGKRVHVGAPSDTPVPESGGEARPSPSVSISVGSSAASSRLRQKRGAPVKQGKGGSPPHRRPLRRRENGCGAVESRPPADTAGVPCGGGESKLRTDIGGVPRGGGTASAGEVGTEDQLLLPSESKTSVTAREGIADPAGESNGAPMLPAMEGGEGTRAAPAETEIAAAWVASGANAPAAPAPMSAPSPVTASAAAAARAAETVVSKTKPAEMNTSPAGVCSGGGGGDGSGVCVARSRPCRSAGRRANGGDRGVVEWTGAGIPEGCTALVLSALKGSEQPSSRRYFLLEEAVQLYRSRLPGCNVDCGVADGDGGGEGGGGGVNGGGGEGRGRKGGEGNDGGEKGGAGKGGCRQTAGKNTGGGHTHGAKNTSGGPTSSGTAPRRLKRGPQTYDFLGAVKDSGSTAVLCREGRVVAACSFVEHESDGSVTGGSVTDIAVTAAPVTAGAVIDGAINDVAVSGGCRSEPPHDTLVSTVARCKGFAELTLLAVSRGRSRRGLGSALLRLVEAWLRSRGVGCAAACAGLDCADFWRKAGYSPETPLLMRWWALLTDPFAHSRVMSKALHDKGG